MKTTLSIITACLVLQYFHTPTAPAAQNFSSECLAGKMEAHKIQLETFLKENQK